jgi:hypothetical protein
MTFMKLTVYKETTQILVRFEDIISFWEIPDGSELKLSTFTVKVNETIEDILNVLEQINGNDSYSNN